MSDANYLIYDGDCPFCSRYVAMTRIREAAGPLRLINARDGGAEVARAREQGFDLDEGMLLHLNAEDFHGADCLNRLALLSTKSDLFNRLSAIAFRSRTVSRLAYPVLRTGRNLTLRLLGKKPLSRAAGS